MDFVKDWNEVATDVQQIAISKGWWDKDDDKKVLKIIDFISEIDSNTSIRVQERIESENLLKSERNDAEIICLMHSELSEALECLRHGNKSSEHIPEFSAFEEELADVVIRIMDYSKTKKHRVAEAILAKIEFNRNRPYKHGGKKF